MRNRRCAASSRSFSALTAERAASAAMVRCACQARRPYSSAKLTQIR